MKKFYNPGARSYVWLAQLLKLTSAIEDNWPKILERN